MCCKNKTGGSYKETRRRAGKALEYAARGKNFTGSGSRCDAMQVLRDCVLSNAEWIATATATTMK